MRVIPDTSWDYLGEIDVLVYPGGRGTRAQLGDEKTRVRLRGLKEHGTLMTSVCTGSLVLGAAGLLRGYRAATHWSAREHLAAFGAIASSERVCVDRNRVTGGGVTAGIDFALTLVSHLVDRKTAEAIQLGLEYNPAPPFNAGSPDTAPAEVLALVAERTAPSKARRAEAIARAAARLKAEA